MEHMFTKNNVANFFDDFKFGLNFMKKLFCLNVKIKRPSNNQTLRHTSVIPPSYGRSNSEISN